MQLAVEITLERRNVRTRMEQEPYFAQLAQDALYYPTRCWWRREPKLVLAQAEFEHYLARRMRTSPNV